MFRKRDPQGSLFASSNLIPAAKAKRLHASWAETFRARALPLIDEEVFSSLYHEDLGRPNRPVQTVLGVLLLKEMFQLTDEEALERLEFDLLWQHALSLTPEEAHLPQKTLHNFRVRLMAEQAGPLTFAAITDGILAVLGTKVGRQRLDSTQVMSNIAVLTRLGLFCETLRLFLTRLHDEHPRLYDRVPAGLRGRYRQDDGSATAYQDARSAEGPRRLSVCARDLYRLCRLCEGTAAQDLEAYALLQRLLADQCEVVEEEQRPSRDDDDQGDGAVPVVLKDPKDVSPRCLQSPHDPDATYSAHKGKGFEVQISETCHADNLTQVITHVSVSPACGQDAQATLAVLADLIDRDQQPQELVADTAYGSAANALEAERLGTELVSPVAGGVSAVAPADSPSRLLTGADFVIDAALAEPAICPEGHFATEQRVLAHPNRVVLTFDAPTCETCPLWVRCPVPSHTARPAYVLSVDLAAAHLERRRRAEADGSFRPRYKIRAGIEATISELKRAHGLGRLRVRGRPRVLLAACLKAAACNLKRMLRALVPQPGPMIPATA
ncbi:MAG: transposase [Candidatus Latescibacterota bacterium]